MNSLNVLITTVGGLTSPDIIKAIKENNEREITLVGVDPYEYAVGRFFVDKFFTIADSSKNSSSFISHLNDIVRSEAIDLIIPCGNDDNLAIAKHIDEINTKVMVSDFDSLRLAYDKGEVYSRLQASIPECAPQFEIVNNFSDFKRAIERLGFPRKKVVVKPRYGIGGRGVYVLGDEFNFEKVFHSKPTNEFPLEFFNKILGDKGDFDDLIVMEHLRDPFYSVYSLCSKGKNIISLTHLREWGNASQTFRGRIIEDKKIVGFCSEIIALFGLEYTINMELAENSRGDIILFDLNPRIGASSGVDREVGVNFPYLALKLALDEPFQAPAAKSNVRTFVRYFDQNWVHD